METFVPTAGHSSAVGKFYRHIKEDWLITDDELVSLIGLKDSPSGMDYVKDLLKGEMTSATQEIRERTGQLVRTKEIMFALFDSSLEANNDPIAVERKWLRSNQERLEGESPMDLMLEGSPESFQKAQGFIRYVARR